MADLYKVMVHVPSDVGWEDDSFASGWSATFCSVAKDGDIATVTAEYIDSWISKSISVNGATYRYLILCLKGDGDFRVCIYDGEWKWIPNWTASPTDYDVKVYDLASVNAGNISVIELHVGQASGKKGYFDFVAFSKRVPQFLEDIMEVKVHQRESDLDEFEVLLDSRGPVEDDTVLLMHFDEGLGGKTFDESKYENHGTLVNSPSWVSGKRGYGLQTDGVSSYIDCGNSSNLKPEKLTVKVWVYIPTYPTSTKVLLGKCGHASGYLSYGYVVRTSPNRITFSISGPGPAEYNATSNNVQAGVWQRWVGTYDKSKLKIYLNGVLEQEVDVSADIIYSDAYNFLIGRFLDFYLGVVVDQLSILNRAISADEVKQDYRRGLPYRVLVHGRHIRVWLNAVKVFAGIVEEVTPEEGGRLHASGRCFGQKLLLRTKSKNFSGREVSLTVKDIVEDLTEVSVFQVETPSPTVTITKDFRYEYITDGLNELAKQAGSIWEFKLGMGHDLRFRSRSSVNVPSCSTTLQEGVNVLKGVKKESGAERLFNKVTVIGGPRFNPDNDPDQYTDIDAVNWTDGNVGVTLTDDYADFVTGKTSIKRVGNPISPPAKYETKFDLGAGGVNFSYFDRLKFHYKTNNIQVSKQYDLTIQFVDINGKLAKKKYLDTSQSLPTNWVEYNFPLSDFTVDSGFDWTHVRYITLKAVASSPPDGTISGTDWWDQLSIYTNNVIKTVTDADSDFKHVREHVLRDEKLVDPIFVQEVANALLAVLKTKENRYRIPVKGLPEIQVGQKALVNIPSHSLSGTYYIASAEHKVTPRGGLITEVVLEKPTLSLEALLAEAIQRQIKRLERSGIA